MMPAYSVAPFTLWCNRVGRRKLSRMASIKAEFGRTVRALRTKAGHSQEGFADAIGITRSHMGKIERGEGNPTLEMLARIARGLKISLAKLFEAME